MHPYKSVSVLSFNLVLCRRALIRYTDVYVCIQPLWLLGNRYVTIITTANASHMPCDP